MWVVTILICALVFQVNSAVENDWNQNAYNNDPQLIVKHITDNINSIKTTIDNQNLVETILELILKHHGSSLNELETKFIEAGENLERAIEVINAELEDEVVSIKENAVVLNSDAVIDLLTRVLQAEIRERVGNNPLVVRISDRVIHQQIQRHRVQLQQVIDRQRLPIDIVKSAIALSSSNREKRDLLQSNPIFDILNELLLGLIRQQFSGVIRGVQETVHSTLNNVTDLLVSLYTSVAPDNDFELIISYAKNVALNRAIQIITTVQVTIDQIVNDLLGPDWFVRRRRSTDEVSSDVAVVATSFFDIIFNPILGLLSLILTPLNNIAKGLLGSVLDNIYPIVGRIVLSPIVNIVLIIIDTILPCINCD